MKQETITVTLSNCHWFFNEEANLSATEVLKISLGTLKILMLSTIIDNEKEHT